MDQSIAKKALSETGALQAAAECLEKYLSIHGKKSQLRDILQVLATETPARLKEGKVPYFNYRALQLAVTGEEKDPSGWFSRHWKALTGEFKDKYEAGLQKFAIDNGFEIYPWVAKHESDGGAGNQAFISLIALPIDPKAIVSTKKFNLPEHDIDYIPAETIALAGLAKLIFDRNYEARGWRKWLLIWPMIIWLILFGVSLAGLLILLYLQHAPLNTGHLAMVLFIGGIAWFFWTRVAAFQRLAEDQILIASEDMIGLKESGVCLELYRPEADAPRRARMVKYAAQCPTCGGRILLDRGEPDFPRRIVGRCENSPREHVFSFDKTTQTGYRLR